MIRFLIGGFAWLALIATAHPVRAQQPPAPAGTASISGVVVDAVTSQPIPHARVLLSMRQSLVKNVNVAADEAGRFHFAGIAAGSYLLYASARRYPQLSYGASKPDDAGSLIAVAEGSRADVLVKLSRGGVVTGRVFSSQGEPLMTVSVHLWQWGPADANGQRSVKRTPLGSQLTDDRGIYRLYDVPPGDYFVATSGIAEYADGPRNIRGTENVPVVRHADVEALLRGAPAVPPRPASPARHVLTFHPSALDAVDAAAVTVSAGAEVTDVDLTMKTVRTATIGGTIAWPSGATAADTSVMLHFLGNRPWDASARDRQSLFRLEDNNFKFENVTPGEYVIDARASTATSDIWLVQVPVHVDGQDISDVTLTLQPGLTVTGRVRFEGAPPPAITGLRVGLRGVLPRQISTSVLSPIDAAGSFKISGVMPGQYVFSLNPNRQGDAAKWWLESAIVNGRDAADFPIDLNSDLAEVAVTISDRPASVSGTVQSSGAESARGWVIVFAIDRTFWMPHARRTAGTRILPDGSYRIANIPAGEYFIAAVADAAPDQWFDDAFLQRLASAGPQRMTIADGEQKTASVPLRVR